MRIDYLIIGQGLAGSLLAWELFRRGSKVLLLDNGEENASRVAAGLINPVTGQRLAKTTSIETLLPVARDYYAELANHFGQFFLVEKPMLRLLRNDEELETAEKRLKQTGYRDYLIDIVEPWPQIAGSLAILRQSQTGYLMTEPLLDALQRFFSGQHLYRRTQLDYREVHPGRTLRWQNYRPDRIIFCEGYQAIDNPWFDWLPFQAVKGEIITAQSPIPLIDRILNYGHWMIPLDTTRFKTGATFDRSHIDTKVSLEAGNALLSTLSKIYPAQQQARITRRQAGVRPATQDRQPFIGFHPTHPELAIFNGFGAKGSLLIPYYCQRFADTLIQRQPLPAHCDIKRYYETHFPA